MRCDFNPSGPKRHCTCELVVAFRREIAVRLKDQQILYTNTVTMTSIASSDAGNLTVEPLSERNVSRIPLILPHERVFPIQIGSELFKLSGASLSSDGESWLDKSLCDN